MYLINLEKFLGNIISQLIHLQTLINLLLHYPLYLHNLWVLYIRIIQYLLQCTIRQMLPELMPLSRAKRLLLLLLLFKFILAFLLQSFQVRYLMMILLEKFLLHSVVIVVRGLRLKVLRIIVELINVTVLLLGMEFDVHFDSIVVLGVVLLLEHEIFFFLFHYLLDHFLILGR
jgi:hypothetical protein